MSGVPSGWAIPSFRGIESEPTILGLPHSHAAAAVTMPLGLAVVIAYVSWVLWAAIFCAFVMPTALLVLRLLRSSDEHWLEHLTSHRIPNRVYLGD